MLNSKLPIIYWDACVPLSYINAEPDRLPHIEGLLADADIQLATSILSVTEVAFAKLEQDGKVLTDDAEARIKKLWDVSSPIEVVEFYELIADDAKNLIRAGLPFGWVLKPADAIHLATADRLNAREFHTYDDQKLKKYAQFTRTRFAVLQPNAKQPVLVLPGT